MTYYDAWVQVSVAPGESETMFLPDGRNAFSALRDAIRSGQLNGERVDHLTWRATVSRAQLDVLLSEIYGPIGAYEASHDAGLKHLADKMRQLRAFIAPLSPEQEIVFTADEF